MLPAKEEDLIVSRVTWTWCKECLDSATNFSKIYKSFFMFLGYLACKNWLRTDRQTELSTQSARGLATIWIARLRKGQKESASSTKYKIANGKDLRSACSVQDTLDSFCITSTVVTVRRRTLRKLVSWSVACRNAKASIVTLYSKVESTQALCR